MRTNSYKRKTVLNGRKNVGTKLNCSLVRRCLLKRLNMMTFVKFLLKIFFRAGSGVSTATATFTCPSTEVAGLAGTGGQFEYHQKNID